MKGPVLDPSTGRWAQEVSKRMLCDKYDSGIHTVCCGRGMEVLDGDWLCAMCKSVWERVEVLMNADGNSQDFTPCLNPVKPDREHRVTTWLIEKGPKGQVQVVGRPGHLYLGGR